MSAWDINVKSALALSPIQVGNLIPMINAWITLDLWMDLIYKKGLGGQR